MGRHSGCERVLKVAEIAVCPEILHRDRHELPAEHILEGDGDLGRDVVLVVERQRPRAIEQGPAPYLTRQVVWAARHYCVNAIEEIRDEEERERESLCGSREQTLTEGKAATSAPKFILMHSKKLKRGKEEGRRRKKKKKPSAYHARSE